MASGVNPYILLKSYSYILFLVAAAMLFPVCARGMPQKTHQVFDGTGGDRKIKIILLF